jgi:hypothetical protein
VVAVESADLPNLRSVFAVLTALIAPSLLITATAAFVSSTSNRLASNMSRARAVADALRELQSRDATARQTPVARWLALELMVTYRRAHLEQEALAFCYAATIMFVACSLVLGVEAISAFLPYWLPVALGLCGVLLLLIACVLLILDVRVMVRLLRREIAIIRSDIEVMAR